MVRITCGGSRVVIILEDRVIKIARFRLLRFFKLPFFAIRKCFGIPHAYFEKAHLMGVRKAAVYYLCPGLFANRQEFRLYAYSHDARLAPTIASYWCGLVNTQERGEPVSASMLNGAHPFAGRSVQDLEAADALFAHQYGRFGIEVKLCDYGSPFIEHLVNV